MKSLKYMYSISMNIVEIETKIEEVEKTIAKIKELISDAKVCSSEITKTLISSAIKKYATTISDFKLEG